MECFDSDLNMNNKQEIINKILENKKSLCEIGKNLFKKILKINTNERKIINICFLILF